jgi:hypothetical protein
MLTFGLRNFANWLFAPTLHSPQGPSDVPSSTSTLRTSATKMHGRTALMVLLFRMTYLYISVLYAACAALEVPGSVIGLAATAVLAIVVETQPLWAKQEEIWDDKEPQYMV